MRMWARRLVSSSNSLTWYLSVRARIFQSMVRRSSPGVYGAVVEILDGEAVVGAAVPAGEEALHDLTGHQFHVADAGQAFGIEVSLAHGSLTCTKFDWADSPTFARADAWLAAVATAFSPLRATGPVLTASGEGSGSLPHRLAHRLEQLLDDMVRVDAVALRPEARGQAVAQHRRAT